MPRRPVDRGRGARPHCTTICAFGPPLAVQHEVAMKPFIVVSLVLVFFLAALVAAFKTQPQLDAQAIEKHWAAVRAHKEFLYNPENYKPDPATGIRMASPPDAGPSLAALVSAGELEHVDLVFPTVPRTAQATQFWIQWADRQDDRKSTRLNSSHLVI